MNIWLELNLTQVSKARITDLDNNRWDLVFDFTETDENGQKVDHFKTLDPALFSIESQEIEGDDTPPSQLPLPESYGGQLADHTTADKQEHTGMSEFTIGTSIADAKKEFDDQQDLEEELTAEEPVISQAQPVVEEHPKVEE